MMGPEDQQPPSSAADDPIADWQDADWRPVDEADSARILSLQHELSCAQSQLAEARQQIGALESLLEDLPEIFERKFSQRLQPVLERQEQLLSDNRNLQQEIRRLAPAPGEVRLRFNPDGAAGGGSTVQLPQLPQPQAGQRQTWDDRIGRRRRAA